MSLVGMDLQDTSDVLWEPFLPADEACQLELRARVLGRICKARPGTTFVKTHSARGSYKGHEMIPAAISAGAVYVVRDPRDVAVSLARHLNVPIDKAIRTMNTRHTSLIGDGGLIQYASDWSAHVGSWAGEGTLMVRHEDLVADPRGEFLKVLAFLGQAYGHCRRLDRAVEACSFDRLSRMEDEQGFGEARGGKFFNNGRSVWREVLTEKQETRIRRRHGRAMRSLGYV